jgi:hypothetical protein
MEAGTLVTATRLIEILKPLNDGVIMGGGKLLDTLPLNRRTNKGIPLAASNTADSDVTDQAHKKTLEPLGSFSNQLGRTRTLDSHASRLRRRLAEATDTPLVLNIWGVGYRLMLPS